MGRKRRYQKKQKNQVKECWYNVGEIWCGRGGQGEERAIPAGISREPDLV